MYLFERKKKKGFIDDTIKQLAEDIYRRLVDSKLHDYFMDIQHHRANSYKETKKEPWEDIQKKFSVRNGAKVHQLKIEVSSCKQNGESVMLYYS